MDTSPSIPSMLQLDSKIHFARPFIYGVSGIRKTWWACQMAELGFNVVYLDGDDSSHVLKSLSPEAKSRFYHLKITDGKGVAGLEGDISQAVMANFLMKISEKNEFIWDIKKRCVVTLNPNPETCFKWRPTEIEKLGTVLVVDSWTAFCESLRFRYFAGHEFNPYDAMKRLKEDHKIYRSHYQWCGQLGIAFASSLKTMKCHAFVIGHEDINEKRDSKGEVISSRFQITGSSRPQAIQLPKYMTDVLHFKLVGSQVLIGTKQSTREEAQSRVIPPGDYKLADLTTEKFMKYHGMLLTEEQKKLITPINFNL